MPIYHESFTMIAVTVSSTGAIVTNIATKVTKNKKKLVDYHMTICSVNHLESAEDDQAVRHQVPPMKLCHLHWSPSDRCCYLPAAPQLLTLPHYKLPQCLPRHFPALHCLHADMLHERNTLHIDTNQPNIA